MMAEAHRKRSPRSAFAATLLIFIEASLHGSATAFYEKCNEDSGGGYCPGQNTCCPSWVRHAARVVTTVQYESTETYRRGWDRGGGGGGGCIPSDLGSYRATCCSSLNRVGEGRQTRKANTTIGALTGCGVGYACGPHSTCVAVDPNKDPLTAVLPRYRLGRQVRGEPPKLYGFPMTKFEPQQHDEACLKLAYYSSHGDLFAGASDRRVSNDWKDVDTVFIVVHGVLRNADDYFCTAQSSASHLTGRRRKVWVIAPLFAFRNESASNLRLANGGQALRWGDDVTDPWRSGANAVTTRDNNDDGADAATIPHDPHDASLSSYRAMDALVSHVLRLKATHHLPRLKLVVVAGHSSGGQYVQRWSLLSPVWDAILMRAVVANPSSYAYLTPERYDASNGGQWTTPSAIDCPAYDQWQWGLEGAANSINSFTNPYVQRQLSDVGGVHGVIERFRRRRVIYLAGSQDQCNVSGTSDGGWCDSHGLETTCMDLLQGSNRWERYHRYLKSLQRMKLPFEHYVVNGVGHDHSLMFQSLTGQRALFSLDDRPNRYRGEESRLTNHEVILATTS